MVESFEHRVDWNKNLLPLQIGDLSTSSLRDAKVLVPSLEPAGPPPEDWPTMPPEDEHQLAGDIWSAVSGTFAEAVGSLDVDSAFGIWCEAATSYLSRRVGVRFPSRGRLAEPRIVPAACAASYSGPSEPRRIREGRRAARCLRECLCILNSCGWGGGPPHS